MKLNARIPMTNTAVTSAVTNFWCHKLIAKVNTVKEQEHRKFYCRVGFVANFIRFPSMQKF